MFCFSLRLRCSTSSEDHDYVTPNICKLDKYVVWLCTLCPLWLRIASMTALSDPFAKGIMYHRASLIILTLNSHDEFTIHISFCCLGFGGNVCCVHHHTRRDEQLYQKTASWLFKIINHAWWYIMPFANGSDSAVIDSIRSLRGDRVHSHTTYLCNLEKFGVT